MNLRHNQISYDINLVPNNGSFNLKVNDNSIPVNFRKLSDNSCLLYINGSKHITFAAEDENNIYVNIDGNSYTFEKVKEEDKSYEGTSNGNENIMVVKPPMPGSIVKVLAEKGQKVSEGDGLIIIEAMKMETILFSSIDGIVTDVNCKSGEQVDTDRILVVVEKEKGAE